MVAIEIDELMAGVIEMLSDEHGVRERVEVVCSSSFDARLEREFDLVVSETIGYLGYDEMIVDVMADARNRFLRVGGNLIPEMISLHAAAGKLNVRTEPVPVGVDIELATLTSLNLHSPRVLKRRRDVTLLTPPVCLASTDLRQAERTPPLTDLTAAWQDLSASPDCVVVWVESRLAPRVNLRTNRRTTSWYPTVYRFSPCEGAVDRLEFSLSLRPESNYWTATFVRGNERSSQSYSPEFAATRMVAAARGAETRSDNGIVLICGDGTPPRIIELRDATPDDEDFFKALYSTTRGEEVAAFGWSKPEQDAFLAMQFTMQTQAYRMQRPYASHSVIVCDGKRAGRIIVDRSDGHSMLVDISVHPDFRRLGIASRMLRQLQADSEAIVLTVDKVNLPARRLYEKFGFVMTGESEFMFTMRWESSAGK